VTDSRLRGRFAGGAPSQLPQRAVNELLENSKAEIPARSACTAHTDTNSLTPEQNGSANSRRSIDRWEFGVLGGRGPPVGSVHSASHPTKSANLAKIKFLPPEGCTTLRILNAQHPAYTQRHGNSIAPPSPSKKGVFMSINVSRNNQRVTLVIIRT